MSLSRRSLITGLVSFVAAPAIVRAANLMPVKVMEEPYGIGPMMLGWQQMIIEFRQTAWNEYVRDNLLKPSFDSEQWCAEWVEIESRMVSAALPSAS
jgi:hypothetical protein